MTFLEIFARFHAMATSAQREYLDHLRQIHGEESFQDAFMIAYRSIFLQNGYALEETCFYENFNKYLHGVLEMKASSPTCQKMNHVVNAACKYYGEFCNRDQTKRCVGDFVLYCRGAGLSEEEIVHRLEDLRYSIYRTIIYEDWIGLVANAIQGVIPA